MKKREIFKAPLLLSQVDIAMLLDVTRSQWAMYLIGQRSLPAKSKIKLAELLTTANDIAVGKKQKLAAVALQEIERKHDIPLLLKDNLVKQFQMQKKLQQVEEKFQTAINTLYFINGIEEERLPQTVRKLLEIKATKVLKNNNLMLQERYKIKLEVLKFEEGLLRKRG